MSDPNSMCGMKCTSCGKEILYLTDHGLFCPRRWPAECRMQTPHLVWLAGADADFRDIGVVLNPERLIDVRMNNMVADKMELKRRARRQRNPKYHIDDLPLLERLMGIRGRKRSKPCICGRPLRNHDGTHGSVPCKGYIPVGGRECPGCFLRTYRSDGVAACYNCEGKLRGGTS